MPVTPQKVAEVERRLRKVGARPEEIVENFIRGSGKGGQKINKTSSCVQLIHPASGIEIRCQQDRSQAVNRFLARRELAEKLEELYLKKKTERRKAMEKIRRQKRRRSRRAKERMLKDKLRQSRKKEMRRKPDADRES